MPPPSIYYFPIKGRAEVMKLILALSKTEFQHIPVKQAGAIGGECKDLDAFPFGQIPRYKDDEVDLVQSSTIIRYLARKHNLYGGSDIKQNAAVDTILDAVEGMRLKYATLTYTDKFSDASKTAFWAANIAPEGMQTKNGGVNLGYLSRILKKKGATYFVGPSITVADLAAFEMTDLLARAFGADKMAVLHPELLALHKTVAAEPAIKAYLAGPQCVENCNGNGLGN